MKNLLLNLNMILNQIFQNKQKKKIISKIKMNKTTN